MSEDNSKTIKVEPHLYQVGTSCMICGDFIPIRFGYIQTTRICDECKKRLKKILYEDVAEGER